MREFMWLLSDVLGVALLAYSSSWNSSARSVAFELTLRMVLGTICFAVAALLAFALATSPAGLADRSPMSPVAALLLALCAVVALGALAFWSAHRIKAEANGTNNGRSRRNSIHWLMVLGLLLIFVPDFGVMTPGVVFLAVMTGLAIDLFRTTLGGAQNRLLWTLALATRRQEPIAQELEHLAWSEKPRWRARVLHLADRLKQGESLSSALLDEPQATAARSRLLPAEDLVAIRIGEETGRLSDVLSDLARRRAHHLASTSLTQATIQQFVILICGVGAVIPAIVGFLAYEIVPKYKMILAEVNVSTDSMTRIPDKFSSPLFAPFVFAWMILLPTLFIYALRIQYLALISGDSTPPWLIRRKRTWTTPVLLRSLASAARAGVAWQTPLKALSTASSSPAGREQIRRLQVRLDQGEDLGPTLQAEGFVNPQEAQALIHAQHIGHLAWACDAIAARRDQARISRSEKLVEFLKPVCYLVLGGIVLFICLAVFVPFVKLIESQQFHDVPKVSSDPR